MRRLYETKTRDAASTHAESIEDSNPVEAVEEPQQMELRDLSIEDAQANLYVCLHHAASNVHRLMYLHQTRGLELDDGFGILHDAVCSSLKDVGDSLSADAMHIVVDKFRILWEAELENEFPILGQ